MIESAVEPVAVGKYLTGEKIGGGRRVNPFWGVRKTHRGHKDKKR